MAKYPSQYTGQNFDTSVNRALNQFPQQLTQIGSKIDDLQKNSAYEESPQTITVPNTGRLPKNTTNGVPTATNSCYYTNPIQLDATKRYKAEVVISNLYDAGVAYYSGSTISAETFVGTDEKFISPLSSGLTTVNDVLSVPNGATHAVLFTRSANTIYFAEMVFERAAVKSDLDNLDASVGDNKVININKVYDNGLSSVQRTLAEALALVPSEDRINGRAIIYNDSSSGYYTLAIKYNGGTFTDENNWITYGLSNFMSAIHNANASHGTPTSVFTLATAIAEVPYNGRFIGKTVVYYDGSKYNIAIYISGSRTEWFNESNWLVIPFTNLQLINSIDNKVDKVTGKGLSANDFTDELKDKLEGIDPSIIVSPEIIAGMVDDYVEENSAGFVTQEKGVVVTTNIKFKLDSTILSDSVATLGIGWSGNISDGFTHTSGNTAELTFDISSLVSSGDKLLVTFNANGMSEATDVYVSCGDSPLIKSYNGGNTFAAGMKYNSGVLKITPASNYTGTITNLKCRKVNANGAEEYTHYDVNNLTTKLQDFIFGYANVILGAGDTASKLQDGTRNIAIGKEALNSLVVGNRNVSIGTYSMSFVTHAENNVSIGSDTTYPSAGSVDNCVAIGKATLTGKDLDSCVAIGMGAAGLWTNTLDRSKITVVGVGAGTAAKDRDTLVGYQSGKNQNGVQNTAIGYRALAIGERQSVDITGQNLTCVGANASVANNATAKAANNSTAIGAGATITKSNQVVLGDSAVTELVVGNKKIIFEDDGTVKWENIS